MLQSLLRPRHRLRQDYTTATYKPNLPLMQRDSSSSSSSDSNNEKSEWPKSMQPRFSGFLGGRWVYGSKI
ncbi:hypothetical protein PRUPE_5G086500 [Prunus persica]|uniref:Uncharacterized protein n=1 Tax=Prunus persica TaxID=3760 RepID=A0A251P943_PRUPE|nr:hypothetical protein PRUPE_5G086500 [Prunus persica]